MSYPLSSDVSSGDITAASQYNNLRSDSLRLGQLAADSVNVGALIQSYESNLIIIRLATNTLRVAASAAVPVGLMIAGVPVLAIANVDLAVGGAPSGAAATWYIFANRAASSTTFTLSVSIVASPDVNQRLIGQFYWNGTEIVKDSIQTKLSQQIKSLLYFKESMPQCGRLTLSTGVPVPTADIPSSGLVFFTPYKGNRVSLYVPDYGWRTYEFTELTLDISGFTTAKNYDIFLYDNAGALTLEGCVWSNDTLRATALYNQDGRWVKNGYLNKLYLGTIHTQGAATITVDQIRSRLIWNNYNRVPRPIKVIDPTNSWTYAVVDTWRPLNNDNSNKFEYCVGLIEDPLFLHYILSGTNPSVPLIMCAGIGIDNLVNSAPAISSDAWGPAAAFHIPSHAIYDDFPLLGYHYLELLEYIHTATVTFYGDNGTTYFQSGAIGWIMS